MRNFFYVLLLTVGSFFMNNVYAYEHEVWRSGDRYYWKTFDVERGSSTDMAVAIEGAMGSGNRDIHIISSGTIYSTIDVQAAGVRLLCHGNTITGNFSGSGILNNGHDGFEIHDLTLRNILNGYGIRSSAASNLSFTNVNAIDIAWIGIRIDSRSSNPWNYTIYNLYMRDIHVENTGSHGIETYGIDGVTMEGTMTARNCGDCGVLLNNSHNGTIETVDAYNCGWGGGYAGLRFANECSNITTETLYADRCGRGFFIVQSGPSSNIHLNYAEIRESSDIGIWIENGTNCSVKSGCSESGVSVSGPGSYANVNDNCSSNGGGGSYVQFQNRATGLRLDGMGRTTNGDAAGQYANTNHYNSHWELIDVGSGYYQLRNRGTGLFLDGMGHTTNGDDVGQWANTTHQNSHWSLQQYSGSYYRLQNRGTGLYLDGMGRTGNGDAVGQWANSGSHNAQWQMISVSGSAIASSSFNDNFNLKVEKYEELNGAQVYPNPVSDVLNVSFPSEFKDVANVQLIDAAGSVAQETAISRINPKLNLTSLANGLYILIIDDGTNVVKQKVIIE